MNSQIAHHLVPQAAQQREAAQQRDSVGRCNSDLCSGETLPLFDSMPARSDSSDSPRPTLRSPRAVSDRHMHVAWELSKALKAVKSGRKRTGDGIQLPAKLTPKQRHKVGNAICEHLLASLRQQVDSEQQISKH